MTMTIRRALRAAPSLSLAGLIGACVLKFVKP
jgi:hypothetical protein